ncbi:RNA-protein complex protein Nop10 [archaeon]|nr:RNA-protein complex protein Nop10 [archaeon]
MTNEILICPKCKTYTLKKTCPKDRTKTVTVKPAKYSPEDKWGKYRRIAKKNEKYRG